MSILFIAVLIAVNFPSHNLPAISGADADVTIVMMEDGLLPETPWEGMTPDLREVFWTYGCRGMMIGRTSWAGYVIISPPGTADDIRIIAEHLAGASGVPDVSLWAEYLGLEPIGNCQSTILVFAGEGDDTVTELPLRKSSFLAEGSDSIIVSTEQSGSVFLWTDPYASERFSGMAWRGIGSEVIPIGETSVEVAISSVLGNFPSNLDNIIVESVPADSFYLREWGVVFASVDSLITTLYPLSENGDYLAWFRGSGNEDVEFPWKAISALNPPFSSEFTVTVPSSVGSVDYLRDIPENLPGLVQITLPGKASSFQTAIVMASLFDRIIGNFVLPDMDVMFSYEVRVDDAGYITVWLLPDDPELIISYELGEVFLDSLRRFCLNPQSGAIPANAASRAGVIYGGNVQILTMDELISEILAILYSR